MTTYSVITIGGTTIASGMTKDDAETLRIAKTQQQNAPHYYEVCEDKTAEKIAEEIAEEIAAREVEESRKEQDRGTYSYAELSAAERAENERNAWQHDPRYGFLEESLPEDRSDNTPEHKSDW